MLGDILTRVYLCEACKPPSPAYAWHLTHAAWNLLRRIEHGNTSATPKSANALLNGHRIAVWWGESDPPCWYTAKVIDPIIDRSTQHIVRYDVDNSVLTHVFMPRFLQDANGSSSRWTPALPTHTPLCPKCGATTRGGTGASKGRLSYTCDKCDTKCSCRDPSALARTDPSTPRVTEDADVKLTQPRAPKQTPAPQPQGVRRSPRVAALAPDAGGQAAAAAQMLAAGAAAAPPPPPRPSTYRGDTIQKECVADATLSYHNANSLGAHGAGKAYLRDVAARLSDVHAISETSWTVPLIATLKDATEADGHRLWACAAHTRNTTKSGTAIFVRSTVKPCPGDGPLWSKPDGKALLAALTIQRQPVILLAAHLPHFDPERVAFLNEVADEVEKSVAAHVATPEGAPWRKALYLWAGDLNLTQHPTLDNEVHHPAPAPAVVQVLHRLNAVMDGAVDVYRTLNPDGRACTHGTVEKEGSQRRLDAWFAAQRALSGPTGVVAARLVPRENAAFSFVNTHTRKECSKESDHDCIQIILRGTSIPRPKARTTLRLSTLRHPDMRRAMSALIAEPDGQDPDEADTLWARIIDIGLSHQRREAAARGKKRAEVLKRIRRLQEKMRIMATGPARSRTAHNLRRQKAKLQTQNHKARRERDEQANYEAQRAAAGQGKTAKPWTTQQPITEVREPATCVVGTTLQPTADGRVTLQLTPRHNPTVTHTSPEAVSSSVAAFWEGLLNDVHVPSAQADRDKRGVLNSIRNNVKQLPEEVAEGLQTANLICEENVAEAIQSLSRGSTPGVDDMGLDFFLEHVHEIAPRLSRLYAEVLARGKMTRSMCHAVLSPLYKEKGSPADRAMYRPISVTTIPYRILAKCIAQKLNLAVPTLVGDPQVGYCTGRSLDENVRVVRQTAHDINHSRPADGGIMLMLDNAKAFDRLQHTFMLDVLQAFNLPPDVLNAVRTLYNGAETSVKVNGTLSPPFPNTSGVKQGCPLSGILYILTQEVQLHMIRTDPAIRGIPIPGPDGTIPTSAVRLPSAGHTLTERGLVDDTMVAVASRDSLPPLLRVLDRFEAMSNHRMNLSKTMVLLLGDERSLDLDAHTPLTRALRQRGLTRTYDITEGRDDRLPDKWHGIVLGNEAGVSQAWADTVHKAGQNADSLQACPMPHGSRGRVALAQSKLMGKACATLRLTVPSDQTAVDQHLNDLQRHADRLVFGKRWWLTQHAATQPRHALGVGHLHVRNYMQAAWAQPLLSAMGRDQDRRPFKHYYARYAREAYPALGMGRELLTLNLSFSRVEALPHSALPGEARQAFKAIAALPPLRYLPPADGEDSPCVPRGDMPYTDVVRQPLLNNPMLDAQPAQHRASPAQETEMLRWAAHGVARVSHVLHAAGRRLLTFEELDARYPGLAGGAARDRVRAMYREIQRNLHRWEHTLAAGPLELVQAGQFRRRPSGQLLRAALTADPGQPTVPASVCEEEPQSGAIRITRQREDIPAAAAATELCPALRLELESDDDNDAEAVTAETDEINDQPGPTPRGKTPATVLAAKGMSFKHAALAPSGAPPLPDPRLLEWVTPQTNKPAQHICLAYATTKQTRLTYLAQSWTEPRSFATRYAPMFAGLSLTQRLGRLGEIASALTHWALPEQERQHLCVTMHHGHFEGANKQKGDRALCARCLAKGNRHEETVVHAMHECPEAAEVWAEIARTWEATTSEPLDVSSPVLTVLGLRPKPAPGAPTQARERFEAREPAWRLLHSVTLLKLHQARNRIHMAYHDPKGSREARRAKPRDILRDIRLRVTQRVQYERSKATHAARCEPRAAPRQRAWHRFNEHWLTTGIATLTKGSLRLNLLSAPPPTPPVTPGTIYIRVAASLLPARGQRPPASAWAMEVLKVAHDGAHTTRLTARGAIAVTATHGAQGHSCLAAKHTEQVARQAAAQQALLFAEHLTSCALHRPDLCEPIVVALPNATTARDLSPSHPARRSAHRNVASNNLRRLQRINSQDERVTLRVEGDRAPERLQLAADEAARSGDLRTTIEIAGRARHTIQMWSEFRVWDPGD